MNNNGAKKEHYVHVGFTLDKEELIRKINHFVPEQFQHNYRHIISVATNYYTECSNNWLEEFYNKYREQEVICYLKTLYVKVYKKYCLVAATAVILGQWHYICIISDDIKPYSLKKMINTGQLGPGIPLDNTYSVKCQTYRLLQEEKPCRYRGGSDNWI
jgi:hypothetical protein